MIPSVHLRLSDSSVIFEADLMITIMGRKLSPGFRFHPTDVELVMYYLKRKVLGKKFHMDAIAEVDIYKYDPWDLPSKSLLRTGDLKWYFFCPREKKYDSGSRMKRGTRIGFWKNTGRDRPVRYNDKVVGSIKTLVFHQGKAPKGDRTDWVMYEYKLEEKELADRRVVHDSYVLCSIFKKDGPGPKNGAQYGAPFKDEDWDDDDEVDNEEVVNGGEAVIAPSALDMEAPVDPYSHVMTTSSYLPETRQESVLSCPSQSIASTVNAGAVVTADNCVGSTNPPPPAQAVVNENDDVIAMLDHLQPVVEVSNPSVDGFDIYKDLSDLGSLVGFCGHDEIADNFIMGSEHYLELMDLQEPLDLSNEAAKEQSQAGGSRNAVPPVFGWSGDKEAFGCDHPL